jgi:lipoprotein-releasing system permease protein
LLEEGDTDFAVPGAGVAWHLSINPENPSRMLTVYVPKRGNASSFQFSNAFNSEALHPTGIFSVQQEFDEKFVFVPLRFARQLLDYHDEVTSVEVLLTKPSFSDRVQDKIQQILGNDFQVANRFQQNRALFKVLKSEKTIIFLILVFILLLSSFNMIGSLSILMIEKNKDMAVLNTLGATHKLIKRIFLAEGVLITLVGSAIGLGLGFLIVVLQQEFGMLSLGGGEGSFVIESYPVRMVWSDFLLVFFTVQAVGYFATWYPVRLLTPRLSNMLLK